jgi:ubiquinone/menaquinone biosynthesis C-methylase UbiE
MSVRACLNDTPATIERHRLKAREQFRRRRAAYAMPTSPFDQKFIAFLISISGVGKTDLVLELACGNGSTAIAFAERCGRAIGVDVLEEPLQTARTTAAERQVRNVDFIISEVEQLSFAGDTFNGVVCRFSFHHFVNPARVFSELARVVAPGGWMVIADMVASEDSTKADLHNQMERLCDPTHSRTLPASEFEQMFAEHGFRVAMKVDRDARLTLEDWIRFGGASPESAVRVRQMAAEAVNQDRAGLKFTRDGDQIRLVHNSISFVIEKA